MSSRYPCPRCGHRGLDEIPGSYSICPVCSWGGTALSRSPRKGTSE
nr:CPCC family cysteine-rich protein [Streptomyces sp. NBC_00974]